MPIVLTYFVHGTTEDNEKNISSGWNDVGLSELGKQQSLELRRQTSDRAFDAVYCSDLLRARQTAELAFGGLTAVIPDARLRECNYGMYNGQPSQVVEPLQEKNILDRFPDGESYEDVKQRVENFLRFLCGQQPGAHVAIVSHKAPQLALEIILNGKTWSEAFAGDWRKTKAWQPGWTFSVPDTV